MFTEVITQGYVNVILHLLLFIEHSIHKHNTPLKLKCSMSTFWIIQDFMKTSVAY
jgi:hypothetical protein